MSGQQIGTVVGGVVGFFLGGNVALGMAIGGAIGGWIDPTQVNGPHIGDGGSQSSAEGVPIPWVIGTCGWLQGNIVDRSPRREVKKTDDGKGSGTEVNTFEAHQDFVLMVCESSEHRESLMTGVLIVKIDGKIVYDMRPGKNFGAQNAKFLRNHTFYNGNESQMPDPTCEAFPDNGVGNTPTYRGVFTVVCRDINLTQYGDRVPTYEFVMVGAGESGPAVTTELVSPTYGRFQNEHWPLVDEQSRYSFTALRKINSAGDSESFSADTIEEIIAHYSAVGFDGIPQDLSFYQGYSASTTISPGVFHLDTVETQLDVTENTSVTLAYNVGGASDWENTNPAAACLLLPYTTPGLPEWHGFQDGDLVRVAKGPAATDGYFVWSNCTNFPDEGGYFPFLQGGVPIYIKADSRRGPREPPLGDPCLLGVPTQLPDAPGFMQDCAGVVSPVPTYTEIVGSFVTLQREETVADSGRNIFLAKQVGPVLYTSDPDNTQAFWEAAYADAVTAGTMPAGLNYGTDYPAAITTSYISTVETDSVTAGTVGLDTAITRICKRGGLTPANDIEVVDMAGFQLLGYMITQPYNAADCIRPLMTAHTCYGSEYDGKLRFHTHGESIEVVVNPDDFIAGSDETDKNTREQEIEYPRLLSVTAIDPTQDYTARPQVERRISPDVNAIGEEQMQVPIVLMPDPHRQLAAIGMKVSWARAQGKREFSVPYATATGLYLYLVAGKPFALEGKRYIAQNVRLEDGEIHFEAVYDRQSAYTSNVTATPGLPPTSPPSSIGGVTLFAAMNLPRLRSKDSTPGMYIAVDGLLDSWPGCALQMSIDDGASWTTAIGSMTQSSVMGYLTAPIDDQPTSTLSVSVHGGTLDSIADIRLADGGNASAVITAGVSELLQFKTATETDPDKYDLTDLVRGGLGTTAAAHAQGDRFVELSSVYFLPLDIALAGREIKFRPVTFGTPPESNAVYTVTFLPQFTGPQVVEAYVNESGEEYANESGSTYLRITN